MILFNNVPYGYSLSAAGIRSDNALRLLLHRRIVESRELQFADNREIQPYIDDLSADGVQSFLPELIEGNRFGFNGSFEVGVWKDDVLTLSIPIPIAEKEAGICGMCHGKEPAECFHCRGRGKDYSIDHSQALAISATFTVLLGRLFHHDLFMQEESSSRPPLQLLLVSTTTQVQAHGGSLWGLYSIPLVAWLAQLPENARLPRISEAMTLVHQRLFPLSHSVYTKMDFYVQVLKEGWLNISCPGQACGLHPHHQGPRPGWGYEFQCHNVDTSFQQLMLLTALAALTDISVAEGVGQ
ncbi:MAG: hypothetical protein Q8P35_01380 [Candidatus Yanofskybacteria bacterium]|nr:hypothetical protein [Candidatus Yanofskybacteria bacterium]